MGLSALPKSIVKQYHRIYLLQSFVRGFRFYDGSKMINNMKEGDMLQLVREPQNPQDTKAIALHFNQQKIGYIPKEDNEILSRLLDADLIRLQAEITHLQVEAKAWENVSISVYVLKESHEPLPENAKYLSILETPYYRTLKISKEKVAMLYYDEVIGEDEVFDSDIFYENLASNSTNSDIHIYVKSILEKEETTQNIIGEGRIIINKNKLPPDLQNTSISQVLTKEEISLHDFFDENGYLVANINKISTIPDRIKEVVTIIDKYGRTFYEIRIV